MAQRSQQKVPVDCIWYVYLLRCADADIAVVSVLAALGVLMAPVSPVFILGLIALVVVYLVLLDDLKTRLFRHLDLH